jgi:hypothetical protein
MIRHSPDTHLVPQTLNEGWEDLVFLCLKNLILSINSIAAERLPSVNEQSANDDQANVRLLMGATGTSDVGLTTAVKYSSTMKQKEIYLH